MSDVYGFLDVAVPIFGIAFGFTLVLLVGKLIGDVAKRAGDMCTPITAAPDVFRAYLEVSEVVVDEQDKKPPESLPEVCFFCGRVWPDSQAECPSCGSVRVIGGR
jgi:hypothetical protein